MADLTDTENQMHTRQRASKMEVTTPLSSINREIAQQERDLPVRKNSKLGMPDEEVGRREW